jgi:hypothetical protein
MILQGRVESILLGMRRKVKVSAFCTLSHQNVKELQIGCGQCHPLPSAFTQESHDDHPAA